MSTATQRAGGERGRLALGEAADACLPAQGLGATRSPPLPGHSPTAGRPHLPPEAPVWKPRHPKWGR